MSPTTFVLLTITESLIKKHNLINCWCQKHKIREFELRISLWGRVSQSQLLFAFLVSMLGGVSGFWSSLFTLFVCMLGRVSGFWSSLFTLFVCLLGGVSGFWSSLFTLFVCFFVWQSTVRGWIYLPFLFVNLSVCLFVC